jgi:CRP-like cAMP-binding protein
VELFIKTKSGRKVLNTLKKGDTFGAYSFFTEQEREVSAICKEFAVILFV